MDDQTKLMAAQDRPLAAKLRPYLFPIRVVFVLLFVFLLLLLGVSMVNHRFFRGGREHPNGSIGQ